MFGSSLGTYSLKNSMFISGNKNIYLETKNKIKE